MATQRSHFFKLGMPLHRSTRLLGSFTHLQTLGCPGGGPTNLRVFSARPVMVR